MSAPTDSELSAAISTFLEDVDLETVTAKRIRKALESKFDVKLRDRKAFIEATALDVIKKIESKKKAQNQAEDDSSESSSDDEPIQPTKPKKRKVPSKKADTKCEVSTFEENGVFYSRTGRPQRRGVAKKQIQKQIKQSRKRKKKEGGEGKKKRGWATPLTVTSNALQDFLKTDTLPRSEAYRIIWDYGKKNDLINPKDKREMILDETLENIFKVKRVTMFKLNARLSKHMKNLDLCGY